MGVPGQLSLDPLPELLPSLFLPSELSPSLVSEADVSELCVDMDQLGLLLGFILLECSDLHKPCEFFFDFFFKLWICCFRASTVSRFFSSEVWSVEDMLFFASIILDELFLTTYDVSVMALALYARF
jgi:hypothetical protein